jgi:hypothetical protein
LLDESEIRELGRRVLDSLRSDSVLDRPDFPPVL